MHLKDSICASDENLVIVPVHQSEKSYALLGSESPPHVLKLYVVGPRHGGTCLDESWCQARSS